MIGTIDGLMWLLTVGAQVICACLLIAFVAAMCRLIQDLLK